MVTLDLETLLNRRRSRHTSTGDRITAEQARRLACQARIIPVVLGSNGEILDLGRASRLFKARSARRWPSATANAPRRDADPRRLVRSPPLEEPWSKGGHTDLADGSLLCPFHHHRAHDPAWIVHHHPNGETTFTRRQ